jgi:hypothetical protein
VPSNDDYNNIDLVTYEGNFYQDLENFGDFEIQIGPQDLENDAQIHHETVVNLKDIDVLTKLHADNGNNVEPPPCNNVEPQYSHDTDSDSDNENPMLNYESDDSR